MGARFKFVMRANTWVQPYLDANERCRRATLAVLGARCLRRTHGVDVMRLIARMVWETRMWDEWIK